MDSGRTLLGYPVYYSQKAAATAASAKDIYFGNWRYVAVREMPELTFLRDPFTVAIKGQVRLLWYFRTVYGVLQAEAIGYAVHPSA
jgi:HK97 family phage major capsid protein